MKLIRYFERKASGKIVQELEGLRFLAIVPVVLMHFTERWYRTGYISGESKFKDNFIEFTHGGRNGVLLFFVISGFILPLPFALNAIQGKPMGNLKRYFMRRLTRLEPPYILILFLMSISAFFLHKLSHIEIVEYFFSGITYSTNLIFHHFNQLNPVIWSLEVEIQFYILAPFITYGIFKIKDFQKRNLVIIGAILVLVLIEQITGISSGFSFLRDTILGQIQYFLLGILMVNFYVTQKLQPGKDFLLWDILGPIAFFSMLGFAWVDGYLKTILFVFTLGILFIGAFRSRMFNAFLKRPWIMAIGGMCYTIYLLHLPIAQGCIEMVLKIHPNLKGSTTWFLAYTFSFTILLLLMVPFFYLFVEKPCMDHSWPTRLRNYLKDKAISLFSFARADKINKS